MFAEKTVTLIPASVNTVVSNSVITQLRMAAYCRVSTDSEEQESSYEAQIGYYTDKINSNSDWKLVKIFADEGITGTSAKKRPEFMKMIKMCEQGKIDLILTKSISRFARNTVEGISYVRQLKEKGIGVIFEKECINTKTMTSEMILTFLMSFSQAESESISKNVSWGIKQNFKNGKVPFQYSRMLGYEKGADGKPQIVPEQAEIVKRVYSDYLSGHSLQQIKRNLESENILSATGKKEWSLGVLKYLLENEKYVGDAILQKTYTTDFLTKKVKQNNGDIPKYYVENNHVPIIDRDIFNRVQEETARRMGKRKVAHKNVITENGKYSGKYALSELLVCGNCGTQYRRVTWSKRGQKKIVWRCISRLEYGTKYCIESPTIEESLLHTAILSAINSMAENKTVILNILKESLLIAINADSDIVDTVKLTNKIAELNDELIALASAVGENKFDELKDKFESISNEIKAHQATIQEQEKIQTKNDNSNSRITEILKILENEDFEVTEYTDSMIRSLIEQVKVLSAKEILVIFKCGYEINCPLTEIL